MVYSSVKAGALAALVYSAATPANAAAVDKRSVLNAYAPYSTLCPSTPLNRAATSQNSYEATYTTSRKAIADAALKTWLTKTNSAFLNSSVAYPTLAFGGSGGGYRAMLNEAGVMQAFDSRDSSSVMSGLYQAMTYQTALSGGGWLLSSVAGANWPTISSLQSNLWDTTLPAGLLDPGSDEVVDYAVIIADVAAKAAAGYDVTLVDPYGRLLGYSLFSGTDGGVSLKMSGLTSNSNFTSYEVPFPIWTSIGSDVTDEGCTLLSNMTQYEFTPYEFGSWDSDVSAFTQTKYLGTELIAGLPILDICTVNLDNLAFIGAGTTGDIFPFLCVEIEDDISIYAATGDEVVAELITLLESAIDPIETVAASDVYTKFNNPFYEYPRSTAVSKFSKLYLGDGGLSYQADPIWPLIQNEGRVANVLFLTDVGTENDTTAGVTGSAIYDTYVQAQAKGLTRMPTIPPVSVFEAGLNSKAVFFGCYEEDTLTIVWIPLISYTYPSNTDTYQLTYNVSEVAGLIGNGNAMATQNGTEGWNQCVGCAVMLKTGATLPSECTACLSEYCYSS